jgi:phosphate-selective porin OprO/OprP
MKLNKLILAAVVAVSLAFSAAAADNTATNTTEAAEIEALKQEVQELSEKVRVLEQERAATPPVSASTNQEQIQALDQKVRIMERQRELDQEAAAAAAKTQPRLAVSQDGVTFASANTNFALSLHGVLQLDSRTFPDERGLNGNDGFILRRARPILSGTVFRDFDYLFVPDFGGNAVQIFDAYVNYRNRPELQLQGRNCNYRGASSSRR